MGELVKVKVKQFDKRPETWCEDGFMDHMMGNIYEMVLTDWGDYATLNKAGGYEWIFKPEHVILIDEEPDKENSPIKSENDTKCCGKFTYTEPSQHLASKLMLSARAEGFKSFTRIERFQDVKSTYGDMHVVNDEIWEITVKKIN